jgi:hypothetical protein
MIGLSGVIRGDSYSQLSTINSQLFLSINRRWTGIYADVKRDKIEMRESGFEP